jgi:hypothetical protein
VQFDKTTGYVILPKDYLRKRHKMAPVKAEYKLIKRAGWRNYFLKDLWEVTPNGELKCINTQLLKEQHGVMSYVLSKFAKNLLTGKSILNISLPVSVFSEMYYCMNVDPFWNYWLEASDLLHYFSKEQLSKTIQLKGSSSLLYFLSHMEIFIWIWKSHLILSSERPIRVGSTDALSTASRSVIIHPYLHF